MKTFIGVVIAAIILGLFHIFVFKNKEVDKQISVESTGKILNISTEISDYRNSSLKIETEKGVIFIFDARATFVPTKAESRIRRFTKSSRFEFLNEKGEWVGWNIR